GPPPLHPELATRHEYGLHAPPATNVPGHVGGVSEANGPGNILVICRCAVDSSRPLYFGSRLHRTFFCSGRNDMPPEPRRETSADEAHSFEPGARIRASSVHASFRRFV